MTDFDLACGLRDATKLEQIARAHWTASEDLADRAAAIAIVRKATDLKRSLESAIAARVCRAAVQEA